MNILFLTRLYNPHVGGVEKHITEISRLLSLRHKITIVTEQHSPDLTLYERQQNLEIYRIPLSLGAKKLTKWQIWNWVLKNLQIFRNSDIIHIHDVFFWILPYKILHPFRKIYITFHGYEGFAAPSIRKVFWHRLAALLTTGNICIGSFHQKWYGVEPNIISYGGVSAKKVLLRKKPNTSIFIGRLDEDTGILDYLEATSSKKIRLDVFGSGPLLLRSKKLSHKYKAAVKYHGFVVNADKYLSGYTMAFVSRYLAILEALINRVPVVAHYNNSIKFDYLYLAPFRPYIWICGNPQELSDAITEINENSLLREKKVRGGYNWSRNQTWEKLASEYEQLWQKPTSQ